jgi:hypothetical protein
LIGDEGRPGRTHFKKLAPAPQVLEVSASEEALQVAAKDFGIWLDDWRTTASAGVRRRDYRISLGISKRRALR